MKPVAELIAVPGKSFPALVFADGFRDLPAGTKLYAEQPIKESDLEKLFWLAMSDQASLRDFKTKAREILEGKVKWA